MTGPAAGLQSATRAVARRRPILLLSGLTKPNAHARELRGDFDPANTVWVSFVRSLVLAGLTVAILAVVAYPIAFGLARIFGRRASLVSLRFVFPLFVSENVRLYGWVLFFIKSGVLDGTLRAMACPAAPTSSSPRRDPFRHGLRLGPRRRAVAETKVLGGQSIIVITHDIEIAFTYAQNWPLGSALAVLLMLVVGLLTFAGIARLDLDRILGRR